MSYLRVIPRDLFNEANLLKCYGRLVILLENLPVGHVGSFGEDAFDVFDIQQNPDDGSLSVANMPLYIGGRPYTLRRPLNSRHPWPLWAELQDNPDGEEEIAVFDDQGDLTAEFSALLKVGMC